MKEPIKNVPPFSCRTTVFNIDNNVIWAPDHCINMISERSCDPEDWRNGCWKIQLCMEICLCHITKTSKRQLFITHNSELFSVNYGFTYICFLLQQNNMKKAIATFLLLLLQFWLFSCKCKFKKKSRNCEKFLTSPKHLYDSVHAMTIKHWTVYKQVKFSYTSLGANSGSLILYPSCIIL